MPSRESACAMAHAIERLLATPKMIPVFPSSNPMTCSLTLELLAGPAAEVCGGIVCRLEKIHERAVRRSRFAHGVVRQHELAHLTVIGGVCGTDARLPESRRLGISISIKT